MKTKKPIVRSKTSLAVWPVLGKGALLGLLSGCVQQVKSSPPPFPMGTPTQSYNLSTFNGKTRSPDEVFKDEDAARLQNIEGLLLEYFMIHKEMPAQLGDLQALVGAGDPPLNLMCPISNRPYGYAPEGLQATDPQLANQPIVVYDPEPAHKGTLEGVRFCIFGMPNAGSRSAQLQVQAISEGVFRTYRFPRSAIDPNHVEPNAPAKSAVSPSSTTQPTAQ